jgi:DNA repair protein RadD
LSIVPPQWVAVTGMTFRRHEKPGKPPSLRVDYHCGLVRHSEWICFEHTGYAREKAAAWWRACSTAPVPDTITAALAASDVLPTPTAIEVRPSGRFTEIMNYRFGSCDTSALTSAPSAIVKRAASAGSTPTYPSAIPDATKATASSAHASARTSVTGGAA